MVKSKAKKGAGREKRESSKGAEPSDATQDGQVGSLRPAGFALAAAPSGADGNLDKQVSRGSEDEAVDDIEQEHRSIAQRQADLVERFRSHLLTHFGSAQQVFTVLDINGDGLIAMEELLGSFETHKIPEEDAQGPFDLRRLFYILDNDKSQTLSCHELMYASHGQLVQKVIHKRRTILKNEAAEELVAPSGWSKDEVPRNTVERFRRCMLKHYPTLKDAFKYLDLNSDGQVTFDEMVQGLHMLNIDLVDEGGKIDGSAAYQSMDVDGSQSLSANEFLGKWPKRVRKKKKEPSRHELLTRHPEIKHEVDLQVGIVHHFRRHLLKHFGDARTCFDALDANGDGDLSIQELLSSFDKHCIEQCDEDRTYFDVRRIFWVLDANGSGALSMDELMVASDEELVERILSRPNMSQVPPQLPNEFVSKNTLERFRRFLRKQFGSLEGAFKALDTNDNGDLSMCEIQDGISRKQLTLKDEFGHIDLKVAYQSLDMDGSGGITISELNGVWPLDRRLVREALDDWRNANVGPRKPHKHMVPGLEHNPRVARRKALCVEDQPDGRPAGRSRHMQKIEDFGSHLSATSLDLSHSCVGAWGAERLSKAVGTAAMRQMKVINLHGSYIGDRGVLKLVPAIEQSCLLAQLVLSLNGVCDVGATRLSQTFGKVRSLVELNLADNHICNPGSSDLAKALRDKKAKLQVLDVRRNLIEKLGLEALKKAVHGKLKVLYTGNPGEQTRAPIDLGAMWSSDVGHSLKQRPVMLEPLVTKEPPVNAQAARPLTAALAATGTTAEFAKSWPPSVNLTNAMGVARSAGEGLFKRRRSISAAALGSAQRPPSRSGLSLFAEDI